MTSNPLSTSGGTLYVNVSSAPADFSMAAEDTIYAYVGGASCAVNLSSPYKLAVSVGAKSAGYYDVIIEVVKADKGGVYGGSANDVLLVAAWGFATTTINMYITAGSPKMSELYNDDEYIQKTYLTDNYYDKAYTDQEFSDVNDSVTAVSDRVTAIENEEEAPIE